MRNGETRAHEPRDPGEIERDIAATRARMDTTLSRLESNLTLGNVVDRVLAYVRSPRSGDGVGGRALNVVKDNPLALGLITAGAVTSAHSR